MDIGLVKFENSPMSVSHIDRHIGRATGDELFLCNQLNGSLTLEQNGRQATLREGEMALLDPLLAYTGKFHVGSELLVLKLPRREIEARIGKTRELLVQTIKRSRPENLLTFSYITTLAEHGDNLGSTSKGFARNHLLDLVGISLGNAGDRRPRLSSARAVSLAKIRSVIEARLTDPELDIETISRAAGISARYANAIFKETGRSLMRFVLERRLAHCKKALEDPAQINRTISEIAYGWGFTDMTHFGRVFKEAFGSLPRDYRRQHLKALNSGDNDS
jgi:AraC-like DNA-binding protein